MPRKARVRSESGMYHVMLRGINRQKVFLSNSDKWQFIRLLGRFKQKCGFELLAYCLMDNHIHLLMQEHQESVSDIIKRIGGQYAVWFNRKYDRVGHLFQDRFRSETIENEEYLLTVIRYIHYNPVKAGICAAAEEYGFSSAKEYLSGRTVITDVRFAIQIVGKENIGSLLNMSENSMLTMSGRLSDSDARKAIEASLGGRPAESLQRLKRHQLAEIIPNLCEQGLTLRQISRVSGIGMRRVRDLPEKNRNGNETTCPFVSKNDTKEPSPLCRGGS